MKTLLSFVSARLLKVLLICFGTAAVAGVTAYQVLQPPTLSYAEDFAPFISGFTSGTVSQKSTVSLILNFDNPAPIEPGKVIDSDLFDFDPSLKGELKWTDQRTLEFTPAKPLDSDQEYYCTFRLGELLDTLPKKMRKFVFKFRTYKQDFRVDYDGLRPLSNNDPLWQQVTGRIQANDNIDSAGTMRMLKATQDGEELKIRWDLQEINWGSHMASFTIDSIKRSEKSGKVHVEINGDPIGVDRKDSRDFVIPSMGDFNVQSAEVEQYPEQSVLIRFSDPIRSDQSLQGMLRIEGQPEPRVVIEDNAIRLFPVQKLKGAYAVLVSAGIVNVWGYRMNKSEKVTVEFLPLKPNIRMVSQGVILPDAGKLYFPFEAVGLKAVDVTIYKLYENNILQFLQVNDLSGQDEILRVGKKVISKRIDLKYDTPADLEYWHRYAIDLGSLIRTEPGAMYRVKLSMQQEYAVWECPKTTPSEDEEEYEEDGDEEGARC